MLYQFIKLMKRNKYKMQKISLNENTINSYKFQLFSLDMYFRTSWYDKRLEYNSDGIHDVTLNDDDSIWIPDLFFNDFRANSHEVTRTNMLVRIGSDGHVLHSKR